MFSTDFVFRQQESFVDNQKCQAGFRPLCNKILLCYAQGISCTTQESNKGKLWCIIALIYFVCFAITVIETKLNKQTLTMLLKI